MTFRRIVSFGLVAAGVVLVAGSFLLHAENSIPYPDPTPELLEEQSARTRTHALLFLGGLVALFSGAVAIRHPLAAPSQRPR